jgi:hypothetical protein
MLMPFWKRLLFLTFLISLSAEAQNVLENNPTSLRWLQVNTPNFRVLFPDGFETQAQRVANTLEHIRHAEARSLGTEPRRISVILQNQSSISNGFVSVLPRRSEFYTMPPQNYNFLGTNDWLDLLSAHEYRHIVQYQHATRGFNRALYYLFGNATLAAMSQAAAPSWFWEGDAVATETAFTHSGRGRIPNFELLFRTNLSEGRSFNYHKQYLGSYKHAIPNHYVLGYEMVNYLRRKTNDGDIWGKITGQSWNVPFIPFAFSNAIKRNTGMYVTDLYEDMAKNLTVEWEAEIKKKNLTTFETVNPRTAKAYTDYQYPQPLEDGSILALKSGIGDIDQFVVLQNGQEKKVFTPGFMNDAGMLSTAFNTVIWNEYGYDPRWRVKNYSLIKMYDTERKEKRVIGGKHARYGSAALSPQGDKIVTVRSDNEYKTTVVVLEIFTGKVIHEFPNPDNSFYAMPRWSDDGSSVVAVKTTREGKTISVFQFDSNEEKEVLPVSQENLGHPVLFQHYLLFNSPANGIDNVYALDRTTGKRYQITESKYGAYNPALSKDGKVIYYNDQTANGLDVVKVPFNPAGWKSSNPVLTQQPLYQHLVEQEGRPNLFDSIPAKTYPIRRYSKASGVLNPYSWGAFYQGDLSHVEFGIHSRDILSTTELMVGYTFDLTERTGFWKAGVSYQGLYPILDVNFMMGDRSVEEGEVPTTIVENGDTTQVVHDIVFDWHEETVEAGFRIPLLTTKSKYSSGVEIGNSVGFTKVSDFSNGISVDSLSHSRYVPALIVDDTVRSVYPFFEYIGNGDLIFNHVSLSAQHLLKRSHRDIYSKWGQAIFVDYFNTPYGGDLKGGLLSVVGYLYFPGFFKHHSLNGYWAYQETQVNGSFDDYLFRNTVPIPRGQSVGRFEKFYSMSANYTLPIWYPDIAIGPVLNIQRVRLNAFADYAFGESRLYSRTSQSYLSVGGELKFDINIMRFLPQLDIGFRYSYGIDPKVTKYEILIGTFNL